MYWHTVMECTYFIDKLWVTQCSAKQYDVIRRTFESICSAATYERTAVVCLQADHASRIRRVCSSGRRSGTSSTKIHRRLPLHTLLATGRCLGQTLRTYGPPRTRMDYGWRYPRIRPYVACSWTTLAGLWTYWNRRSTICWCCSVTVGQSSAYSGRSVSAD